MTKVRTIKIQNIINNDNSAAVWDNGYLRVASVDDEEGGYTLSHHKGEMPAFQVDNFDTIEELCAEMKRFADLRKWGKLYDDNGNSRY